MDEVWVPAFGFEGLYEVSDQGNVRRLGNTPRCRLMRPVRTSPMRQRGGYLSLALWRDNKGHAHRLHRLIYVSFMGTLTEGNHVHHINGKVTDNRLANLMEVTPLYHASLTDHPCGESHSASILTEQQVTEIRSLYVRGVKGSGYRAIGNRFGIRSEYVRDIITGRSWSRITSVPQRLRPARNSKT